MRKQVVLATLVGLGLRLFFVWRFPAEAGDTAVYEQLAGNWIDHHVYGLFLDGHLTPVDVRAPGYPAFLAVIYVFFGRSRLATMLVQAAVDLLTCFLTAVLAARLAPEPLRQRAAMAALWLATTCPFVAKYATVPLTEVLATFLTAAALVLLVKDYQGDERWVGLGHDKLPVLPWFVGSFLVGLGTLVRPETPLLLASTALVLAVRWRRPAEWAKLVRAGVLMAAGLLVPLVPWAARNWHTVHRVQFLVPRYLQMPGEFVPRGFYAWTDTWLVRLRDVYLVSWRLEDDPIPIEDLPASAFDSPEERALVAALLAQYNETTTVSPELDREFAELARERAARHPLRTYLWIPLRRAVTIWFTPRTLLLPYSGHLWPPRQQWQGDPVGFSVTVGFGLVNFFYVGLALVAAWQRRCRSGLALLVAFLLVRTAFFATQVETPEPRYVVVCFPAVLALAALAWPKRPRQGSFQE